MINECAPLLPEDIIKRAEKLNVALILDGVKAAKIDIPNGGCMDADINPLCKRSYSGWYGSYCRSG